MKRKYIEFEKWFNGRALFSPAVSPMEYKHVEMLSDNYVDGLALFYGYDDDKNAGSIYLGKYDQAAAEKDIEAIPEHLRRLYIGNTNMYEFNANNFTDFEIACGPALGSECGTYHLLKDDSGKILDRWYLLEITANRFNILRLAQGSTAHWVIDADAP